MEVIYIESREKILSIVVTKLATEYDPSYHISVCLKNTSENEDEVKCDIQIIYQYLISYYHNASQSMIIPTTVQENGNPV